MNGKQQKRPLLLQVTAVSFSCRGDRIQTDDLSYPGVPFGKGTAISLT
ncbi:MAG: hypothetical protein KJ069_14865 [Anaerolineae bacterium]|nr:hypothetical protein [Anaerolineae bacterium]